MSARDHDLFGAESGLHHGGQRSASDADAQSEAANVCMAQTGTGKTAAFGLPMLEKVKEIGCTLIRREEEKVTIGFNMLIDAEFLHHVRRLSFETNA